MVLFSLQTKKYLSEIQCCVITDIVSDVTTIDDAVDRVSKHLDSMADGNFDEQLKKEIIDEINTGADFNKTFIQGGTITEYEVSINHINLE